MGPEALPEGAPFGARVRAHLAQFATAMATVVTPGRLAPSLALSLLSWALQLATYHVTARAAGLPDGVSAAAACRLQQAGAAPAAPILDT